MSWKTLKPKRAVAGLVWTVMLLVWPFQAADAVLINYTAPTGQTATADFSLTSGIELVIFLTETTPAGASALMGAAAVLTSVGFLLPDSAVIVGEPDGLVNVTIAPGSASVGFSLGDLAAGAVVSREWGATIGGELPIDSAGSFDFVSTNAAQVTRFTGANRDGPAGLNGPQGGLLDDSAARGGLGVIDNSVEIHIRLDANPAAAGNQALSTAQQAAFLASLATDSIVEYGSNAAFGTPSLPPGQIPAPATLLLLGSGLLLAGLWSQRRS